MQELSWKDYKDIDQHREYPIPPDAIGVDFAVDHDHEAIGLVIGGNTYSLTIQGARDLALALRQNANAILRENRKGK